MKKAVLLALVFACGMPLAQEKASDHPYSAVLVVQGDASHYRFALPAAAYRGAARRDIGDLRIFNAAGEPVPYAFAPREAEPPEPTVHRVNVFPLHGDPDKGLDSTVTIQRNRDGTVINVSMNDRLPAARRKLIGYIADTSELKLPVKALVLGWEARGGFSGHVRVESSDDLKNWNVLASNAPVIFLQHAGATLERNRVDLHGTRAKYLRLSFQDVAADFRLKDARVELRPEKTEPQREWLSFPAKSGKAPGEFLIDSEAHFPVDRVRLALPQANTVAPIQLFTRERAEDPWRPVATAVAYRLARADGELTNPDIALSPNADRYWRMVVDQKGGGFGAGEVRLEFGWLPHEVLFAARGAGPFTMAYGNRTAKYGALPLATVLPRDERFTAAGHATVSEFSSRAPSAPSFFRDPGGFFRGLADHPDAKKWMLWAALFAGVLFLGWMSLRLLRDLGKDSDAATKP